MSARSDFIARLSRLPINCADDLINNFEKVVDEAFNQGYAAGMNAEREYQWELEMGEDL